MQKLKSRMLFIFILTSFHILSAGEWISKADSIFDLRNIEFNDSTRLSNPFQINEALVLYQQALDKAKNPEERHETMWKILRTYYYKGTYTVHNDDQRRDIYNTGIRFSESFVAEFPGSPELHCWTGILWGYLGEVQGIFTSARKGVAGKVKYFAERTIDLDETYLDAGGYRMLGTAHMKVPKIPLFLGWPSKKKAVDNLEKAHQMAPNNLLNKIYLAEAYYETGTKDQAYTLLKEILETDSLIHDIAVDATVKHRAEFLLNTLMD